jgi:hypothetical protein
LKRKSPKATITINFLEADAPQALAQVAEGDYYNKLP